MWITPDLAQGAFRLFSMTTSNAFPISPAHTAEIAARIDAMMERIILRREEAALHWRADARLQRAVHENEMVRLINGAYLRHVDWQSLYPEDRLLARSCAHALIQADRQWVFSHESAAVLWGLPLYGLKGLRAHIAVVRVERHRNSPAVARHASPDGLADVVEVSGVRFTGMARTLLDLAAANQPELAIGAIDAGLRRVFAVDREHMPDPTMTEWLGAASERLERASWPGVRSARLVLEVADPRSDSVLESVSRLQLHRLGVEHEIQVPVRNVRGSTVWMDFEFLGQEAFGEVDGEAKYRDERYRADSTPTEVVLAEKWREDAVRSATGKRVIRWGHRDLWNAKAFGSLLQSFGLQVPKLDRLLAQGSAPATSPQVSFLASSRKSARYSTPSARNDT